VSRIIFGIILGIIFYGFIGVLWVIYVIKEDKDKDDR